MKQKPENNKILKKLKDDIISPLTSYYKEYKKEQEEDVRSDLIDKFFGVEILGWDMKSDEHLPPSMREVRRENKRKVQGRQKYPDYIFIVNKHDKFYVEAKRISVKIKEQVDPAIQLRRYGRSHDLPLCILTNAAEFAIYDTTVKVRSKSDSVRTARVFYCTYEQLLDPYEHDIRITNFEYIYQTFSKDAVVNKSLDNIKTQKGNQPLDKEFLEIIDEWRLMFAKSIANNNPKMDEADKLNYAVQKLIDRLIFLRIAEDKDIEDYETLLKITTHANIYKLLNDLFEKAKEKYNSELFESEEWLSLIKVDDDILSHIINELYESYAFSVMPIEILGSIYEQFLGKVIKLTENNHVKIEPKPEVRKAGGVYYTPQYIVEYIVRNTVNKKINKKTPDEISNIKILDPACGSGSFLIGAYQHLLDYHFDYYWDESRREKSLKQGKIYHTINNDYYLSIPEKQRILKNNIYGVDIDKQAVEVTRLSLLLTLMKEENREIEQEGQAKLFKENNFKYLPALKNNIKCGNSLIGPDFYDGNSLKLFDDRELKNKINDFDWNDKEKGFGTIMMSGGFDCVIGNPPYVFTRELMSDSEKEYFYEKYINTQFKLNTYVLFCEKSFNILNENGIFGFIIPNNWLSLEYNSDFRKYILSNTSDIIIVNASDSVFLNASVDTSILVYSKKGKPNVSLRELTGGNFVDIAEQKTESILRSHNQVINIHSHKSGHFSEVCEKVIKSGKALSEIAEVKNGVQAYTVGEGQPTQTKQMKENRVYHSNNQKNNLWLKYVDGVDVKRYYLGWSGQYIKYGCNLSRQREPRLFQGDRLLVRQIPAKPPYSIFSSYTNERLINDNNSMIVKLIHPDPKMLAYIMGILNSRLISFWFIHTFGKMQRKIFPQFKIKELSIFPIKPYGDKDKNAGKIPILVTDMLETQKKAHSTKSENDKKHYQQKIEMLDKQIDELVYDLYGLTKEEIKVVEGEK